MIANRYRIKGITLWWCPFLLGFFRGVSILDGSFPGVGAFSMVGHSGVQSSMKIFKKMGLLVSFGGGRLWAVRGGKIGEAHFRVSHILLTQNRNAVRECA